MIQRKVVVKILDSILERDSDNWHEYEHQIWKINDKLGVYREADESKLALVCRPNGLQWVVARFRINYMLSSFNDVYRNVRQEIEHGRGSSITAAEFELWIGDVLYHAG